MNKRRGKKTEEQLERFFMEIADAADAAMREYQQERGDEHRLFIMEFVRRTGIAPEQAL